MLSLLVVLAAAEAAGATWRSIDLVVEWTYHAVMDGLELKRLWPKIVAKKH